MAADDGAPSHRAGPSEAKSDASSADHGQDPSSIRVETRKLDRLVDLVGEMVISVAHASRALLDDELDRGARSSAVESLDQLSRDLQERVMGLRMVPVMGTFERLTEMAHGLSRELGKQVRLEILGDDTELDKNVIERLASSLGHLVDNAVRHGIERPEVRLAAGKPAEGELRLQAFQREGSIVVEVADDGVGLEGDGPDELGRPGSGLDVVRRGVADLRGRVEMESIRSRGSCFRLCLPLSMAIIDAMTVRVGSEILCIPLLSIVQQLRPRRDDLRTVEGKGELVKVRGRFVPLARVHAIFGFDTEHTDPTEALVVVLETEGRMYGALVDDVLGQEQAVVKNLDRNFRRVDGLAGATILGNGEVSVSAPARLAKPSAEQATKSTAGGDRDRPDIAVAMILDVQTFEQMAFDTRSGANS